MRKLIAALTVASAFAVAPAAHAADEAFLRIDGLQGDAVIGNSKATSRSRTSAGAPSTRRPSARRRAARVPSKAAFQELSIEKAVDAEPRPVPAHGDRCPDSRAWNCSSARPARPARYLRYHFQMAFITARRSVRRHGRGRHQRDDQVRLRRRLAVVPAPARPARAPARVVGLECDEERRVPVFPAFGTPAL